MAGTPFDVAAILIVLAAAFGYVNHRFVRLPASAGLTLMGAVASLIILGLDRLFPTSETTDSLVALITSIDFHQTLMNGMLSFLLFAGALHVDWSEMRRGRWPILVLSTIGVVISTGLIGGGFLLLSKWLGHPVPLIWCLIFGALISPTDPVAVSLPSLWPRLPVCKPPRQHDPEQGTRTTSGPVVDARRSARDPGLADLEEGCGCRKRQDLPTARGVLEGEPRDEASQSIGDCVLHIARRAGVRPILTRDEGQDGEGQPGAAGTKA